MMITWHTEQRRLGDLKEWDKNPRQLSEHDAKHIKTSMDKFGVADPLIINLDNSLIGGHQRKHILSNPETIVDVRVPDRQLNEREAEELAIRLNKNTGAWDFDLLANGFDVPDLIDWGFTEKELQLGGFDLEGDKTDDPGAQMDRAEELREKWGVESGQLWQLGEHRLICGDCTDRAVVERVMGGEKADITLTDPPYGLGEKKESGKNDYQQYNDTRENLIILAEKWLPIARSISKAVFFFPGVTNAWIYPESDWVMCWFYAGGQLRSPWGVNCWQPILCYGKDPSLAGGHGGRPDAVEMNVPANANDIDHPCPKPLTLWEWLVNRLSFNNGEVVYDPFLGSGTTLIACERLGRKCRAIEISPAYCSVAIQRWADMGVGEPQLLESVIQAESHV